MRRITDFVHNAGLDLRQSLAQHVDLFHDGRKPVALFLRIPFTRLSMWIEWRGINVGFGHEAGPGQWEFFAGRLQGVFCIEPITGR